MKVPQFMPWVGQDEYKAIESCFTNNWITEGPKAKEFSEKLLKLMGVKYGVLAPNGTLAIYLALKSLDVGPGDEVIVPDFTFIATANAVQMCGATPIFADIDSKSLQIDANKIEALITSKTKAIMPAHIFGTVGDMGQIVKIAKKNNLLVVEDAAQAVGVHYKDKHAGTIGDVGTFSFFADKSITTAEGGFVVTDDKEKYEKLLFLRNQGRLDRGSFIHPEIGYNFRMTDLQCAVGLVQIDKLDKIIQRKLEIKEQYEQQLGNIKEIRFQRPIEGAQWIPFRVVILCEKAHKLMEVMKENEIEPRTVFYPLHKQPCYSYLKDDKEYASMMSDENFTNTNKVYDQGICLPTYPQLTDEQVSFVCSIIKKFYE